MSRYISELHNKQECYWPTIYRAGAALVSTITSLFQIALEITWLPVQGEFTTPEKISPKELNKCLQKFYLSARKRDGRSLTVRQNCNEIVGNSKNE